MSQKQVAQELLCDFASSGDTFLSNEVLEKLNLESKSNSRIDTLSGGEAQRVSIARALAMKPKIIFADEPSGNLDSENATSLHEIFFKLRNQTGCTMVIVTHNDKLAEMADRKIIIKDGKIIS